MFKLQPIERFKNPYEKHFKKQREREIEQTLGKRFVRFSQMVHPVAIIIMAMGTTALLFLAFRVVKLGTTPYVGGDIFFTMNYIMWGLHLPLRILLEWWKDPETHGLID